MFNLQKNPLNTVMHCIQPLSDQGKVVQVCTLHCPYVIKCVGRSHGEDDDLIKELLLRVGLYQHGMTLENTRH